MRNQKKNGIHPFRKGVKMVLGIVLVCILVLWGVGWYAPVNKYVPYGFTLSRKELRDVSEDLLIGNRAHVFQSPASAQIFQRAWGADDSVYGLQALSDQAKAGKKVHYEVFSEEERAEDPSLEQVGLYCLHSDSDETKPYVVMLAGGGFSSVCTPWESLPVCAAFQEKGYTCFALTYRTSGKFGKMPPTEQLMGDVAACISYITEHAEELHVDPENYLIGGFSAGSMTTNMWANEHLGWKQYDLPAPGAVCLMYGTGTDYNREGYALPTFSRYCLHDQYFKDTKIFTDLADRLSAQGIANDFKGVDALHGFGQGTGTEAEGWTDEAEQFWKTVVFQAVDQRM